MSEKKVDLCIYRMRSAIETLGVSALCLESQHYKDSINRSYYAAFYAVKAVLALEEKHRRKQNSALIAWLHIKMKNNTWLNTFYIGCAELNKIGLYIVEKYYMEPFALHTGFH